MPVAFALLMGASMSHAADRFEIIPPDQMNAEQKKLFEAIVGGPRSQNYGGDAVNRVQRRGPFNAWMRSPELGMRLQAVGEFVRFKTSIPQRLNEFAILITAREWTSQYEWYAHHILAMKAGLDPKIAEDIAAGKRPANMKEDEAAVYDFCIQLHRSKKVERCELPARQGAVRRARRGRSDRRQRLLHGRLDDAERRAGADAGRQAAAAQAAGLTMKVFITGATGYIGGSVARKLIERGDQRHRACALGRRRSRAEEARDRAARGRHQRLHAVHRSRKARRRGDQRGECGQCVRCARAARWAERQRQDADPDLADRAWSGPTTTARQASDTFDEDTPFTPEPEKAAGRDRQSVLGAAKTACARS